MTAPFAYAPPDYTKAQVIALQAVAEGTADETQQKRALAWIIKQAANAGDLSWRPGVLEGDRETSFA